MPPAGFEPTIPASERSPTHALDREATGNGCCPVNLVAYPKITTSVRYCTNCQLLIPRLPLLYGTVPTVSCLSHDYHFCTALYQLSVAYPTITTFSTALYQLSVAYPTITTLVRYCTNCRLLIPRLPLMYGTVPTVSCLSQDYHFCTLLYQLSVAYPTITTYVRYCTNCQLLIPRLPLLYGTVPTVSCLSHDYHFCTVLYQLNLF